MAVTIFGGDNRASLRSLIDSGTRVHSVVTDPPYGLVSVQKRFGKEGSAAARTDGNDGSFARLSGGFMGKAWDGTGIERDPEFWRLIWEILLPGGYVFAFSGSRTGHWQACAMEQAGFIMHPMHGWLFGSGFPKAHAADKAIDKMLGVEGLKGAVRGSSGSKRNSMAGDFAGGDYHDYVTATPEAAQWEGWAYGTQAQKPALEPIYLGQKPFSEKTGAANLLKHGVGAVNIDGCRVAFASEDDKAGAAAAGQRAGRDQNEGRHAYGKFSNGESSVAPYLANLDKGRHPANLMHDGSAEVLDLFPNTKSGAGAVKRNSSADREGNTGATYGAESRPEGTPMISYADSGSASRFFNCFPPDMDPIIYQPKASKADRAGSKHPTVKPIALMQHLIRHITPPGGTVLDPFAGSGTTGEAAKREGFDCILMEAEPEYVEFLKDRFPEPDWSAAAAAMLL